MLWWWGGEKIEEDLKGSAPKRNVVGVRYAMAEGGERR